MAHLHSIYDTDLHFIIDPITRRISSESGKVTLMQKDHNSERFTFEVPRYIEGHDMSLTDIVQVHYNNIEAASPKRQNKDVYPVLDLQISPDSDDVVIFSWLISGNATQYVGSLNFIVRFVCYDGEEIVYQWWSDTYTQIKIAATMDNTGEAVDLDDTDILESWRQECIRAVFESEVFSTLKAQGMNYVEQAKAYANQAKEISGLDTVEPLINAIQTMSTANISQAGWYRVAEYSSSVGGTQGNRANSCRIILRRVGSSFAGEYELYLDSQYNGRQTFGVKRASISTHVFTKIRYVYNETEKKAYIEVYCSSSNVNMHVTILEGTDDVSTWYAITPTFTEETVDGVTVTTTYDIPVNASPVTDLDLTNVVRQYMPITYESLVLKTSILETAVSLPVGSYDYALGGAGYTGDELPDNTYTYGTATINKRSSNSIFVMMWGHVAGDAIYPPIFNYYNGIKWSGWQTISTVAELMTVQTAMQTAVDNIQTTSRVMVNAPGWYRVAELSGSSTLITYYNCFFNLVSRNSSGVSTSATFLLNRTTNGIALNPIGVVTKDGGAFSKVRVTTEGVNNYIEVYYAPSASNACAFSVFGSLNMDSTTNAAWKALKFIPTSDNVDGVTVTTTYDIPANASPVTDLDLNALINGTTPVAKATYAATAGSAPASDVYPWAKASTKPSYTKSEVGLGNVDNTADSAKSVKYAADAGNASKLGDNSPSYFATAESVNKIVSGATTVAKANSATTASLDGAGNDIATTAANLSSEIAVERARISQLSSLSSGSTTGDAELMGIRIDVNGVDHDNAGDAVRAQFRVRNVKSEPMTEMEEVTLPVAEVKAAIVQQGEETKAAIAQKGVETLETIPDDYTTLANEVAEVKSDLSKVKEDTEVNMMSLINGEDMQKKIRTQFEVGRKEIDGTISTQAWYANGCFSFAPNKTGGLEVYFTDPTYKYNAVAFLDGALVYQGSWETVSPIVIGAGYTFDELYINVLRLDTENLTEADFLNIEKSVYYTEAITNTLQKEIEELEEKAITTGGVIDLSNVSLPVLSGKTPKVYYQNLCDGMLKKFLGFEAKNGEVKGYSDHCQWEETEATTFNPLVVADWTDFQTRKFTNHYINLQHVNVASASGSKKCLLLGDSMTDQGHYQKYANDCFEGSGLSVEWLGTRESSYGLKHEGRSGWRAYTYTHFNEVVSSDYEGLATVNPFWNPNTNAFDFSYYMTQQGYSGVDYVFICLGTNDLVRDGATDENTLEAWATIINSIKAYNANAKVVLWLCPPTCLYNGEAQAGQALNRNYRMRNIILNNYRGSSWGNNNVWILPINLVVDPYNDFPVTDGYATDVTHPTLSGYEKMGNVVGAMVHYLATL